MIEIAENFYGDAYAGNFCKARAENGEPVISRLWNMKAGYWKVDFKILSKDSKCLQSIGLVPGRGFKGSFYMCGKRVKKPVGAFAMFSIWEYCNPNEFSVYIESKEGGFGITNGLSSYNILTEKTIEEPLGFYSVSVGGMAMIPEKIGEAHFRMNCNDMDFDDDFNDFIFDVKFTEIKIKEEWTRLVRKPTEYEIKIYEPTAKQ